MSGSSASPIVSRSMSFSLQRVGERDALVVLEVAHGVGLERARGGGGAEQRAPEARALLVGPVDQLQRDRRRLALVAAEDLERRAHAEAAVEPAAVRHGVDVRADDDDLVATRPAIVAHRFPATSRSTSRRSRLELAEQPFARACASPRSRRAGARRPGPPVSSASSCRSLSGRSQSKSGMHEDWRNSQRGAGFLVRMIRWGRITGLCRCPFLPARAGRARGRRARTARRCCAAATTTRARGGLRGAGHAAAARRPKMQMRFTLQARTPDEPKWRKVDAAGFGAWITAPRGRRASTPTTRPSQDLLAPASYRAVVDFRWRDAARQDGAHGAACSRRSASSPTRGRTWPCATSATDRDGYVARRRQPRPQAAGAFDVDFMRDGTPIGTLARRRLAPGAPSTCSCPAGACGAGEAMRRSSTRARRWTSPTRTTTPRRRLLTLVRPPKLV